MYRIFVSKTYNTSAVALSHSGAYQPQLDVPWCSALGKLLYFISIISLHPTVFLASISSAPGQLSPSQGRNCMVFNFLGCNSNCCSPLLGGYGVRLTPVTTTQLSPDTTRPGNESSAVVDTFAIGSSGGVVGYLTLQGNGYTIRYNPIPNVTSSTGQHFYVSCLSRLPFHSLLAMVDH